MANRHFTYFKITGWGWHYLSTVLDDLSRFIIAWRFCAAMSTHDVADTLDDAFVLLERMHIQPRSCRD